MTSDEVRTIVREELEKLVAGYDHTPRVGIHPDQLSAWVHWLLANAVCRQKPPNLDDGPQRGTGA